jgi:hypothetical protein
VKLGSRVGRVLVVVAAPLLLVASAPAPAGAADPPPVRPGPEHTFSDMSCRLISTRYAGPVGNGRCPGVRPGAATYAIVGKRTLGVCTLNFIFKGRDGYTYAGTAGHCVSSSNYEKKWPGYTGKRAYYNPYGPPHANYRAYMGNYAYGVYNDTKDFALIRLKPGLKANPKMCYFGGPDGMYTKHEPGPALLKQFGNGVYWGSRLPARTHVAPTMIEKDGFFALGQAGPGDSGSGVINASGQAVGVLVAGIDLRAVFAVTGYPGVVPWVSAAIHITRLDVQLARAQKVLRTRLTLLGANVSPLSAPTL